MEFKRIGWRWRYYTDYDLEDRWFYSENPEWEQDHPELIGVIELQELYIKG
jgi:hypothetical protein